MATATHTEDRVPWSISPPKEKQTRIYSGTEETIVLTVSVSSPFPPTGAGRVELRRNGAPVSDGLIDKVSADISRTWFLTGVKTLDLVARDKVYFSGVYAISVMLPKT